MSADKKEEENKDFVNITDDGGVKKRIIKEGTGVQAVEGNEVKVNYIGKNGDKIFDQTKECPNCGVKISETAKFCPVCGTEIQKVKVKCPNCGKLVTKDDLFCKNCGVKLRG